ncbi:MAG: CopG family transcriptional regulator [Leptolyngbya sp. BL-A-14]
MQISTLLDDDRADKLAYIQQQTQQDVSEVMQAAIDLYYEQLQPTSQTPLKAMQEIGFVGCIQAEPNL